MKPILTTMFVLMLAALTSPVLAQSNGPVSGEGPGGSGANQSSLGPSKAFLRQRSHSTIHGMRRHRRRG